MRPKGPGAWAQPGANGALNTLDCVGSFDDECISVRNCHASSNSGQDLAFEEPLESIRSWMPAKNSDKCRCSQNDCWGYRRANDEEAAGGMKESRVRLRTRALSRSNCMYRENQSALGKCRTTQQQQTIKKKARYSCNSRGYSRSVYQFSEGATRGIRLPRVVSISWMLMLLVLLSVSSPVAAVLSDNGEFHCTLPSKDDVSFCGTEYRTRTSNDSTPTSDTWAALDKQAKDLHTKLVDAGCGYEACLGYVCAEAFPRCLDGPLQMETCKFTCVECLKSCDAVVDFMHLDGGPKNNREGCSSLPFSNEVACTSPASSISAGLGLGNALVLSAVFAVAWCLLFCTTIVQ